LTFLYYFNLIYLKYNLQKFSKWRPLYLFFLQATKERIFLIFFKLILNNFISILSSNRNHFDSVHIGRWQELQCWRPQDWCCPRVGSLSTPHAYTLIKHFKTKSNYTTNKTKKSNKLKKTKNPQKMIKTIAKKTPSSSFVF
jgi:hypothetical protein